ncbi:MAG TPA: bifunctional RNase H/acid phosphatase [Intrasporangium sp.]|nr:bifunctional RNase H/acid phosphatase [Intrasporangium sp.]
MAEHKRVVIEADGGSRGNPGPAAYGAVLKDADTGEVIAEDASTIGIASNNVAEYSGLIAGLRLAEEFAPDADVEVRMDSKLVVEQMSGRWKIKHASMKPLALEANRLAPSGTTYTWWPREKNQHADRLANEALDGKRAGVSVPGAEAEPESLIEEIESPSEQAQAEPRARGWSPSSGPPTTLVLVRHGVTAHTTEKRFSGGLASANPGLSDEGRDQIRSVASWLSPLADRVDAVVTSPVRRTRESAEILAEALRHPLEEEPGFAEMEFGTWDGLTFVEVAEKHQADLDAWLGSLDVAPGGSGESFRSVEERVLAGLQRVLDAHAGKTVVVVSHVTPIKTLVAHAVDAPLTSLFRMELSPGSVTVMSFFTGGRGGDEPHASLRMYNALPPGNDLFAAGTRW